MNEVECLRVTFREQAEIKALLKKKLKGSKSGKPSHHNSMGKLVSAPGSICLSRDASTDMHNYPLSPSHGSVGAAAAAEGSYPNRSHSPSNAANPSAPVEGAVWSSEGVISDVFAAVSAVRTSSLAIAAQQPHLTSPAALRGQRSERHDDGENEVDRDGRVPYTPAVSLRSYRSNRSSHSSTMSPIKRCVAPIRQPGQVLCKFLKIQIPLPFLEGSVNL